ncbi:11-beta-hydroxysteroid dehydrogenase-like 2 isoform X2 [Eurytemora carolleeae]|uniref:11-beta-hydroxysteroid dehydrogenase-like 2 isoform X1 n=1 Tax=Eurytemora carolleeae TaxID=1294199 RepID=UPI000C770557|nr:11-beta-hydroxysteroid dehydrogenase-like 2 isoform X1 [Eurytemora carolleeae]XP_023333415.1 11-beta-hydroxysteroid dehydrogenase-like 2 isoform X2 [Eurytemora carolleeae]|eukprot:XP_023333414.1 11-beta-hydroxysteroid dehydrogenase-like 2 isoform X1 [Eurytemora affinis]
MSLAGKVAIITGASSGIGAATAIHLAKLGVNLAITGRNIQNLEKTEERCRAIGGAEVFVIQGDVSNETDCKNIIDSTVKHFKKLDILVNNAGILEMGSIENTSLEQYDRVMNTNVRAVYNLTMLAVPHLEATKGNIVNVSSVNGIRSFPGVLAYNISKAALDQLTR